MTNQRMGDRMINERTSSHRVTAEQISRRRIVRLGSALPVLLLATCVDLPGQGAPPRKFRLTPKSTFADDLPDVNWALMVEEPDSQTGLDRARIALLRNFVELDYFANVEWSGRAPTMVQELLIESFKNSGHIEVVGNERLRVRPDFVLKPQLREFQAVSAGSGAPSVQVALTAKLVKMPRRDVVGTTRVERSEDAASEEIEAVVSAFDGALGGVMKRLVEWTLVTGNASAEV